MMNICSLIKVGVWCALAVSMAAGVNAAPGMFVRPAGWHAVYRNEGFASKTAATLSAGVILGTNQRHELGLEGARLSWAARVPLIRLSPGSFLGATIQGKLTPVLANYRFHVGAPTARWRGYAGVDAGMTTLSGDLDVALSGIRYGGRTNDWEPTWGGTVGISVRVSPRVFLDAGYRYMRIEEPEFEAVGTGSPSGALLELGDLEAHGVSLGLTLRL